MSERWRTAGRWGAMAVFWGWNLWFLVLLGFGLGPILLFELIAASALGLLPLSFAGFAVLLLLIPPLGMAVGFWRFRSDPGRLLSLFYGLQFPLMFLVTVRLFAVQMLTPATTLTLCTCALGAVGLLLTLWRGPHETRLPLQGARLVAQTAYLLAGLGAALLAGIYGGGLLALLVSGFASMLTELPRILSDVFWHPYYAVLALVWVGFASVTILVVFVFPIAMIGISARTFQLVYRSSLARLGALASTGIVAGTVLSLSALYIASGRQPQHAAFATVQGATNDGARREALERATTIRRGLLNARLARERTFESDPEADHLIELWRPLLGDTLAEVPRGAFRLLFAPFRYHPVLDEDSMGPGRWRTEPADVEEASRLYASFFDAPIEIAERERLLTASRQTWSWREAQAGLLDIGQQRVHLARQEIEIEPLGDLATVEIHDVYQNRTFDRQEVVIHFSLPESAAVTGLWLGTSDDRDLAFPFVVAPRGAAQEVYEREVRRQVDPALLEQVGPSQYRLRAFPVEPRAGRIDDLGAVSEVGPELHTWIELVVPMHDDGDRVAYAMPRQTEVRNLYWDADSVRTLNGTTVTAAGWLPAGLEAPAQAHGSHQVVLSGYEITAERAAPLSRPHVGRVAVLVDGTRSMASQVTAVDDALRDLRRHAARVDVLCVVEQTLTRCDGYEAASALFYGAVALETRLAEAADLVDHPDVLVVLTDAGSYPLAAAAEAAGLPDATLPPLWLVHLGGYPAAWPDWTLDRVQRTNGGVVTTMDELWIRLADPSVQDGWRWKVRPTEARPTTPSDPFVRLAARRLIRHLDQTLATGDVGALDALHRVAVEHQVVSAYSSMIVLVDDAQRERLAQAEQGDDRFDREVLDGVEPPLVTSTPEPAAWLLTALGASAWLLSRKRRSTPLTGAVGQR